MCGIDFSPLDALCRGNGKRAFFITEKFDREVYDPADAEYINEFPDISPAQMQELNELYNAYLFYTPIGKSAREYVCSNCLESFTVVRNPGQRRTEIINSKLLYAKHNERAQCPQCHTNAQVKSVGKAKSRISLWEGLKVVLFVKLGGGAVGAMALDTAKSYSTSLKPLPAVYIKALYRFKPGEAIIWKKEYADIKDGKGYRTTWKRGKTIHEAWNVNSSYMCPAPEVWIMGDDVLKSSFLRYAPWSDYFSEHGALTRCLAAYCVRPQLEILVKIGLSGVANDMVLRGKKLTRLVDWSKKKPAEAFGLTSEEFKLWRDKTRGDTYVLDLYRGCRRHGADVSLKDFLEIKHGLPGNDFENLLKICKKLRIPVRRAENYLKKQKACADGITLWKDYIAMAEYLKFDLKEERIRMPKKLREAHDTAAELQARVMMENARTGTGKDSKLFQKLEKRYSFQMDGYVIRPPVSAAEIIAEGQILHHCVAGYADRHMEGKLVILFMRKASKPGVPTWTIEMQGDKMIQVQGERDADKNKPRAEAKEIFDLWLDWVKAGSQRNKDGSPRLPKKEDEVA